MFREEQCLRDICVTFKSLFRLILHFFFSLIDLSNLIVYQRVVLAVWIRIAFPFLKVYTV